MARVIDDFATGTDALDLPPGGDFVARCQSGTMIGGGRRLALSVPFDPREEPSHVDVGSGTLDMSLGAEQFGRIDIVYGVTSDGAGGCKQTFLTGEDADFRSMGSVIRTNVRSTNTLFRINFNVVVFTATGRAQAFENFAAQTTGRAIDCRFVGEPKPGERPFVLTGDADFSRVGALVFIFQNSGSLVLDSLEVL